MFLAFVILTGLLIRLISLNQSLWLDEATSVVAARDYSFSEILTKFSPGDFHPPLYYLILKIWMSLVGSSEMAARMISVVFGSATIWVVYKIAKSLQFTNHQSLITSLLLATAPLHIYYSQEARMYILATLFATIVVYFVAEIITSKKRVVRNFIWLIICSAALLYTDYLPIFLLISLFIYLIIYEKKYLRSIFRWVGATTVLFLPWLPTFITQLESGMSVRQNAPLWWATLGKTNIHELALVPIKFMIGKISSYDKVLYGISIITAAIPFTFTFLNSANKFQKTKLLWFWFLGPLFLAAVFGALFSGFSYFRLLFILPAFYLLVAYGTQLIKNINLRKLVIGGLVGVNLIASGIYLFNPRFHREDWRSAVVYIENNSRSNSAVVFVSKNQRDPYHYYAAKVPSFGPEGAEINFSEIWLMRYVQSIFDPKDETRAKIESKGYTKLEEKDFNGVTVWKYVR